MASLADLIMEKLVHDSSKLHEKSELQLTNQSDKHPVVISSLGCAQN